MLKKIYELTEVRLEATKYLMGSQPWDLFFTVITETDRLQHFFWGEQAREGSAYRDAIREYFEYLDGVIGKIIALAPPETTVLVVSDHGMGEARRKFFVNEWLAHAGFLKFKASSLKFIFQAAFHKLVNLAVRFLVACHIDVEKLKRAMPPAMIDRAILLYGYPEEINWRKTRAWFSPGLGEGLVINLAGRFPEGTVTEAEAGAACEALIQGLSAFKDPDTGEPVVRKVHRREELYSGEATAEAADLILEVADGYTTLPGRLGGKMVANVVEDDITGEHRRFGLVGALGPGVAAGTHLEGARITDIAPTILRLLKVTPTVAMDGQVIVGVTGQDGNV